MRRREWPLAFELVGAGVGCIGVRATMVAGTVAMRRAAKRWAAVLERAAYLIEASFIASVVQGFYSAQPVAWRVVQRGVE